MSQELLDKAKSLGIKAEGLTEAQLKKAIVAAEKSAKEAEDASKALKEKASVFGISTDNKSDSEIAEEIADQEEALDQVLKQEIFNKKSQLLVDFLEIENFDDLSSEELKTLLDQKVQTVISALEVSEDVVEVGKTNAVFKLENGSEFVFTEDAPASFRYLGVLRSQEEWIEDKDSMELMIATKISYVTPKK